MRLTTEALLVEWLGRRRTGLVEMRNKAAVSHDMTTWNFMNGRIHEIDAMLLRLKELKTVDNRG